MSNELEQWINLSLRSPSGDNCQPWILKLANSCFTITIDQEQAQHFLDQNLAASWISVGALYENLSQSAAHFGFSCRFEFVDDLTIKVFYESTSKVENQSIIETINNRYTFRGILNKTNFRVSEYAQKNQKSAFSWGQKAEIPVELIGQWAHLETLLWLKTPLMRDFTKWVHLSINGYLDGVTIKNLMLNTADALSLLILKWAPFFIKLIPFWYFRFNSKNRLKFLLNNSSGIIYLTGKITSYQDYFRTGREIQSMWLYLTSKGLKAQPLAIESLYFNYTNNAINRRYLSEREIKKIHSIKQNTQNTLGISDDLIFMLRVGVSSEVIEKLPRKNLELLLKK